MNAALNSRRVAGWLGSFLAVFAMHAACSQEPVVDPPARVARLSYLEGDVTLAPAGTEEWADAALNRPLTSGDKLWVDRDGRAELQVGASTIHLDRSTGFGFVELDDDVMQMSVTGGAATVRVRRLAERETVQLETPNATVFLRHPGEYQFEVDPESDRTIVKVRSGEAEIVGTRQTYQVRANEEGVFTGLDDLQAKIGRLPRRTAFEAWANDRDRRSERSTSARYVSRDVIGYEDLDDHGEWIHEPSYGHVWRPLYVAHDWAPYRYGRWAWIAPWGWTWVDDARWGFAPFHYGRWAYLRHRWCWVPGPRYVRPVYAPALVGWIGGPSVSVSVSFGHGVGWFPLAPHEVYVPWHRHTPRYIRHVNVSNTVIVNNTYITNIYGGRARPRDYRHRGLADAVTVARREAFVGARRIGGNRMRVEDRDLRALRANARPPAMTPERRSILAGEPRRVRPGDRPSFADDHPNRRGDFRTTRPGAAGDRAKRPELALRDSRDVAARGDVATRNRAATRERSGAAQPNDRVESIRGDERRQDARRRDHMERPPAQSLRSTQEVREQSRARALTEPSRPQRDSSERSRPQRSAPDARQSQAERRNQMERALAPRSAQRHDEPRSSPRREVSPSIQRREVSPPVQRREVAPPVQRRESAPSVQRRESAPSSSVQRREQPRSVERRSETGSAQSRDQRSSRSSRSERSSKHSNPRFDRQ